MRRAIYMKSSCNTYKNSYGEKENGKKILRMLTEMHAK